MEVWRLDKFRKCSRAWTLLDVSEDLTKYNQCPTHLYYVKHPQMLYYFVVARDEGGQLSRFESHVVSLVR